ncbi:MAG TPA: SoxR reducing system RseC family protein [Candidatus Omnitrophota bacterium]|nr:SoxR reducing system RseC family protein [Candidatus Omnitrophota bacterium]
MMHTSRNVEHQGVVKELKGRDVFVELMRTSACGSCESRQHCGAAETQHQILVFSDHQEDFTVGEEVNIVLEQAKGFKALVLAYLLPLGIVVFSLLILSRMTTREYLVGGGALLMLVPYYVILHVLSPRLKGSFQMKLYKKHNP